MKHVYSVSAAAFALLFAIPASPQTGAGRGPVAPVVQAATPEEAKWLTFMREEEKMARDVYRFLYERWNLRAFDRIADSEETHFAQVGTLLKRYGITDPAAADTPGVFANEALAKLYSELTTKGAVSLKDAVEVGLLIESQDIADLEAALKETVKLDIKQVFVNLMNASFQHQEAFEFNLELLNAM